MAQPHTRLAQFGQDVIVVQSDTYYMAKPSGAADDHADSRHSLPLWHRW
jgi:hypothetical protein